MYIRPGSQPVVRGAALVIAACFYIPEAAGQIVAVADASGRSVYVNASSPRSRLSTLTKPKPSKVALGQAKPPEARFRRGSMAAPLEAPASVAAVPPAATAGAAGGSDLSGETPPFDGLVRRTAAASQVDPRLVRAIIEQESEYNPHALSAKGAMGLMQLIPATARRFGVSDPFDPAENVQGGVSYLRYLLNRFGGDVPLSLAAYNAGENAVVKADGIPEFHETRDYVRKVSERYGLWENGLPENSRANRARRSVRAANDLSSRPDWMPSAAPVYRYVDTLGIVHYSQ